MKRDLFEHITNIILLYIFPISYVAFLFSGLIKGWKLNFGIDATILFLLASILSFFLIERDRSVSLYKFKKSDILKPIISLVLFLAWYSLTAIWTLSNVYYIEKLSFLCILLIFFFLPLFCKDDFVDRFFKTFVLFGTFISVVYFIFYCRNMLSTIDGFPDSLKVAYLSYGRLIAGISFLLISSGSAYFGTSLRVLLIPSCVLMLCISGARGPILFFILVLLIFMANKMHKGEFKIFKRIDSFKKAIKQTSCTQDYFYTKKIQKSFSCFLIKCSENQVNVLIVLSLILFLFTFYFLLTETLEPIFLRSFSRLGLLLNFKELSFNSVTNLSENLNSGLGDSANVRIMQYYNTINYILYDPIKFFIGWGIGSYGLLENGVDSRHYPHNFILEIFVESGFIGASLFFIMVSYFLSFCIKKKLLKNFFYIILLITYFFLCFLTSSSIAEARIPFALLGILLLLGERNNSEYTLSKEILRNEK